MDWEFNRKPPAALCEQPEAFCFNTISYKEHMFDAFADKSVAAEKRVELDDKTFGNMIKEKIDRISAEENAGCCERIKYPSIIA